MQLSHFFGVFASRVEVDPDGRVGRAELFTMPRIQASSPVGNDALNSSFQMVAGAGFDTEKTSSWDWEEVEVTEPALV